MFILTGCEDLVEIEKQSYVIAIGIDQTDQEGMYQFTFQIANPSSESATDTSGQVTDETVSIPSSDIITATDIANDFLTKKINLDHTQVIIISEEHARSGDFIRMIQPSSRTTRIKRSIQIIVTKENAEQFLRNANPKLDPRPHKYYQFMITRSNETGVTPDADFHRFFQATEGNDKPFLAVYATTIRDEGNQEKESIKKIAGEIIQTGGNPAQFMGSAIFKDGKMIDILTGQETRLINMLNKTYDMDDVISAIPDPIELNYSVSGNFVQKKDPKVTVQYEADQNHATIDVIVPFDFEIVAIPSLVNYSENNDLEMKLKKALEEYYAVVAEELIDKTQKVYQTDPFYWSLYFRRFFKDIPSYEKADWSGQVYPNADITIRFQLDRLDFGKSIYDTNLKESSD